MDIMGIYFIPICWFHMQYKFVSPLEIHWSERCVQHSNMMSFIGYMNDAMMKLLIYFDLHIRFVKQSINIISKWIHIQWNLCNLTNQRTREMYRNTQVLSWLTELLRDRKLLLDVTGCRKTQVSDCTSSTVFIQGCTTGLYKGKRI